MIAINSSAIQAQWELPPLDSRNGIIRGYKLFVQLASGGKEMLINIPNNATDVYIVGGLELATSYRFSVLAYTSVGDGPRSIYYIIATLSKHLTGHWCKQSHSTSPFSILLFYIQTMIHLSRNLDILAMVWIELPDIYTTPLSVEFTSFVLPGILPMHQRTGYSPMQLELDSGTEISKSVTYLMELLYLK